METTSVSSKRENFKYEHIQRKSHINVAKIELKFGIFQQLPGLVGFFKISNQTNTKTSSLR